MIRLIAGGILHICSLAASAAASRSLLGPAAPVTGGVGASGALTGIVQVAFATAAALAVAVTLRRRRFRLLTGLAAGAVPAAEVAAGIFWMLGDQHPVALADHLARGSWLASAAFPGPPLIASAAAVIVVGSPWMSRPWRRAAWIALLLAVAARLVTGAVLPMEVLLAVAAGVTAGAAVLVAFGVPDRRMDAGQIAEALRSAGLPAESVRPAGVPAKGSRRFATAAADGTRWFIKALGSDQRDADLLYRAYRAVRLRNVGDTRPAASLFQAVEHQALAGVMAERAGVFVPRVDRVVRADGTALLLGITDRHVAPAGVSAPCRDTESTYDPGMSDRKTRLTVTVDPHLAAYAEQLVETGKAPSVSAVFNDALAERVERDKRIRRRWKEAAERTDPEKVDRMIAHVQAQAAVLPDR